MARFTLHGATLKFNAFSKVIHIGAIFTHTEGLDNEVNRVKWALLPLLDLIQNWTGYV